MAVFIRELLKFCVVLLTILTLNPCVVTTEITFPEPPDVSTHKNIDLLPKECGPLNTGDRLIGGNKTGIFEFPWMALLTYQTDKGQIFFCGSTIINKKYILTAAHCLTNLSKHLLKVRVGDHNVNTLKDCEEDDDGEKKCAPPFEDLTVEEIIPHSEFKPELYTNDIGLLRVSPMNFTLENVKPVCLPLENARNFNYTRRNGIITGWGTTETGVQSPELLKIKIPVLKQEDCVEAYASPKMPSPITITYRQLCAGGNSKSDSCTGDSGGPLHVTSRIHGDTSFIQQGIVSFGPKECSKKGVPGVYTRVTYYMDWILDNIKP